MDKILDDQEKDLSFEEVYFKYYQIIEKYCTRKVGIDMAQDITIDTFALLSQKWDTLYALKGNLIYSWLCSTVDNKCKEYYRKRIKDADIVSIDIITQCCIDESIDGTEENQKYLKYLEMIRKRLSENEVQVYDRVVVRELSYAKTAEELHISEVNVRVQMSRIRKKIKSFIKDILG